MDDTHAWKFFRTGGFDQVRLDTGADLLALRTLDQKLWVALSCPVQGIDFPADTLQLLDADHDGHVRAPELLAALAFVGDCLRDTSVLIAAPARLPLSAIDTQSETGARVHAAARRILTSLGRGDATEISIDDVADRGRIFGQTRFNGDGVITAETADGDDQADLQALIGEIGSRYGTRTDRSGQPGIDTDAVTRFFDDVSALATWRAARPASEAIADADLEPALASLAAVREKIDDYFTRCRLAAYDPGGAIAMNASADELLALGRSNLATPGDAVANLPLAHVAAEKPLPLASGLNPAWAAAIGEFARRVVAPVLGPRDALAETDWRDLVARLAALSDWLALQPDTPVTTLEPAQTSAYAEGGLRSRLEALLTQDLALSDEFAAVDEVDRLLHFVRDLARFANNFVAFRDFYTGRAPATFQAGTLYLDGRSCKLCVAVNDPGKHASLATLSRLYLAYCDCTRGSEKMTIAAAVTAGDADQIMIGRNGVFYDREGRDWDATVVKLIDHPISLRQAFWAPYRKIGRMVNEQIQKFATARQQAVETQAANSIATGAKKIESAAAAPPKPATAAPPAPPPPFDVGKFAGIFAAIGLALGALGTAVASVMTGFIALRWWQMPLAIAGLMLLVSGPSMLIAWFKLRARNLGPLLDANGWAVNSRALINIPFGTSLTELAHLPPGAERAVTDPYAEKRTPWGWYALALIALLALLAWMARGLGG